MCPISANPFSFTVTSPESLIKFGEQLASYLQAGMTILLHGELGAGKTTLTKGIAQGLGITKVIKSPTYTLIREYTEGRLPLYHMDVYRLEDIGGDGIGFEDYFFGQGVSVVEWSQFITDELPSTFLEICIDRDELSENTRHITVKYTGEVYSDIVNKLKSF